MTKRLGAPSCSPPTPHAAQEEALRRGASAGDTEAFGALLRLHQGRLFAFIGRLIGREAEAMELTQEVFVRAFELRHRFDFGRPMRPWLFKIALNMCRNHRRLAARRERPTDLLPQADSFWRPASVTPEQELERSENALLLRSALLQLSDTDREILLLRLAEDLTYEELSRVYRRPQSVLKMRVHRALKRLKRVAEPIFAEGCP